MKKALLWLCPLFIAYGVVSCRNNTHSSRYLDAEGIPFKGMSTINDLNGVLDSTEAVLLSREIGIQKVNTPKTDMVVLIMPELPTNEDGKMWNSMELAESVIEKWELDKYDSSAVLVLIFTKLNTQYITATKNIVDKFTPGAKQFIIADGVYQHYQKGEYAAAIGYTIKNVYAVVNNTYLHGDVTSSRRDALLVILAVVFAVMLIGNMMRQSKVLK